MTKKECRELANKIIKLEIELQSPLIDGERREQCQNEIMQLCDSVTNLREMLMLDNEIQNILESS